MALRYSACNLLTLNRNYPLSSDTYELCRNVGILRCTRYIHRASRRWFTRSSADAVRVPIFHRKSRSLLSSGVDFKNLSALNRVECASSSSTPPRLVKAALLNARSVNNKAALLSDIIIEEEIDLVCLTETWHKQCDGLLFNLLPRATDYSKSREPRGGVVASLYCTIHILTLSRWSSPILTHLNVWP